MRCDNCGSEVTVYELTLRSYRLYVYLCRKCREGFLAHHFDLNLEIYQMGEVAMKDNNELVFITGLETDPRVFEFKVKKSVESVVVADDSIVLGELALGKKPVFAPYSDKAVKRLKRYLKTPAEAADEEVTKTLMEKWETAK